MPSGRDDRDLISLRAAACARHGEGRVDEALAAYETYLRRRPDDSAIWCNLGVGLRVNGKLQAAAACYRRALELQEDDAGTWGNLGNVLADMDQVEASLAAHVRAVALRPDDLRLLHNYARALCDGCRFTEALEVFDRCLALDPDHADVNWDRALPLLHLGRYEAGWAAYEWRWKNGEVRAPKSRAPTWQGEDLAGRAILLFAEQGFGDTLLAARFIPAIKARGASVTLVCNGRLRRLFERLDGVDRLLDAEPASEVYDYQCSLMSLPGRLGATLECLPPPPALTIANEARRRAEATLLPSGTRFKVGIVWTGSAGYKFNHRRSVSIERFLPLAGLAGLQLYSLYKGPREDDLSECGAAGLIVDIGRDDEDFADAAAVIEKLDLVITVDTAIGHLAGALGRPVWTLLNFAPFWTYGPRGTTTPWYPSMRLYRQPVPGDWDTVFECLTADLAAAADTSSANCSPARSKV